MCVRMVPLTYEEAAAALGSRESTGRSRVGRCEDFDPIYDAYPGSELPAYVRDAGRLVTVSLDLCQDFGHGIERNHAAIGIASGLGSGRSKKASLGSVRSKKSAMASAGTL